MRITLNRHEQWLNALLDGVIADGNVLRGMENSGFTADLARIILSAVDSFEHDHIWDAFKLDWRYASNTNCRISCYASNSKLVELDGTPVDLDVWLLDDKVSTARRAELSQHLFSLVTDYDGDGLLSCKGRYLWLRFDIAAQNRESFELRSVTLTLPGEKIIDYLPDIYRKEQEAGDFFPRFMAIFNSIFFELEDDIDSIGEKLDYRSAGEDMLKYLATWIGAGDHANSRQDLRKRLSAAIQEYGMSGTRAGLMRAVEGHTGFTPIIVEHQQIEKMLFEGRDRQTYSSLFGTNPYKIHIMLPEQALATRVEATGLTRRIRSCVPAHIEFEIVALRRGIRLDMHTYLEINSYLDDYSGMILEERSVLYHDVYIGGQSDEE